MATPSNKLINIVVTATDLASRKLNDLAENWNDRVDSMERNSKRVQRELDLVRKAEQAEAKAAADLDNARNKLTQANEKYAESLESLTKKQEEQSKAVEEARKVEQQRERDLRDSVRVEHEEKIARATDSRIDAERKLAKAEEDLRLKEQARDDTLNKRIENIDKLEGKISALRKEQTLLETNSRRTEKEQKRLVQVSKELTNAEAKLEDQYTALQLKTNEYDRAMVRLNRTLDERRQRVANAIENERKLREETDLDAEVQKKLAANIRERERAEADLAKTEEKIVRLQRDHTVTSNNLSTKIRDLASRLGDLRKRHSEGEVAIARHNARQRESARLAFEGRGAFGRLALAVERVTRNVRTETSAWIRHKSATTSSADAIRGLFSRVTLMLISIPMLVTAVGLLGGALYGLAGGIAALLGPLGNLASLLAILPGLGAAAGAGLAAGLSVIGPSISRITEGISALDQAKDRITDIGSGRQPSGGSAGSGPDPRDIRDAEERLAEARREAALSIAKAERDLARTRRDSLRQVKEAEIDLRRTRREAQDNISDAETNLFRVRRDGLRNIKDLEAELLKLRTEQTDAVSAAEADLASIREADARRELELIEKVKAAKAAQAAGPSQSVFSPEELAAGVAAAQAELASFQEEAGKRQEQQQAVIVDAAQTNAEDIADAEQELADARVEYAEDVADAEERLQEARIHGAEAIRDAEARLQQERIQAQEAIADAERALAEARIEAINRIRDAEQALQRARTSGTAGTAGAVGQTAEAFGDLNNQLAKLSPLEIAVAKKLIELRDRFRELTAAGRNNFLQFFLELLNKVDKNLPAIAARFNQFTNTLVGIGRYAVSVFSGPEIRAAFTTVLNDADTNLGRIGRTIVNLVGALIKFTAAASPFLDFIFKAVEAWSQYVSNAVSANKANGDLAKFFTNSMQTLSLFSDILSNIFIGFKNIGTVGGDTGRELVTIFRDVTEQFRAWTESTKGQAEIKKFVEDAKPVFIELGRLIRDIGAAFIEIGQKANEDGAIVDLFKRIREDLLPVIVDTVSTVTKEFGPKLIDFFVELVELIGHVAQDGGPLSAFIEGLGKLIHFINNLPAPVRKAALYLITFLALGVKILIPLIADMIAAIQTIGKVIGFILKPLLKLFFAIDDGGKVVFRFSGWIKTLIGWIRGLGPVLARVGGFMARFGGAILNVLKFALKPLGAIVRVVMIAIAALAAILGIPIEAAAALVVAIIAIVAAIVYFLSKNETFKNAVKKIWDGIKSFISAAVDGIKRVTVAAWHIISEVTMTIFNGIKKFFMIWFKIVQGVFKVAWFIISSAVKIAIVLVYTVVHWWMTKVFNVIKAIWNTVRDVTKAVWKAVRDFLIDVWQAIWKRIHPIIDKVRDKIRDAWAWIREKTQAIWRTIKEAVINAWYAIRDKVSPIVDKFKSKINDVWTSIRDTAVAAWDKIVSKVKTAWNAISSWVGDKKDAFKKLFKGVWEGIRDSAKNAFESLYGKVAKAINKLVKGFNKLAGKVPGIGKDLKLPEMDKTIDLAKGGYAPKTPGGIYRVAEAGYDELVLSTDPRFKNRTVKLLADFMTRMGITPNFAKGGYVQGAKAPGDKDTRTLAEIMFAEGFNVTSAHDKKHAKDGYHYRNGGQALDFGDSANNMGKVWSFLFPNRQDFEELFGPKGLYHGTSKFSNGELQSAHNDHVHVAYTGNKGQGGGGGLRFILNLVAHFAEWIRDNFPSFPTFGEKYGNYGKVFKGYGDRIKKKAVSGIKKLLPGFANGGEVTGGFQGAERIIRAHVGEWVLNPRQQQIVANFMGGWDTARQMLFTSYQPQYSFASGGIIPGYEASSGTTNVRNVTQNVTVNTSSPDVDVEYVARMLERRARGM